MKEQLEAFIQVQAYLAGEAADKVSQTLVAYNETRHASMAIGHVCPVCTAHFDAQADFRNATKRFKAAKALLEVL